MLVEPKTYFYEYSNKFQFFFLKYIKFKWIETNILIQQL